MAKQQVVTLDLSEVMGIKTAKEFEQSYIALFTASTEGDAKWLELALVAPNIFGNGCFDKSKDESGWNEDYLALKDTLEHAVYATQNNGAAMPEIKRLAKGEVRTAVAEEEYSKVKTARGCVSEYVNRMGLYFAKANAIEGPTKAKPTLKAWCGTQLVALQGKPETTKAKAQAPRIAGRAPQELLDVLALCTIEDAAEARKAWADWRASVAKTHAGHLAAGAIAAIQAKPRKVIKSDAPARKLIKA